MISTFSTIISSTLFILLLTINPPWMRYMTTVNSLLLFSGPNCNAECKARTWSNQFVGRDSQKLQLKKEIHGRTSHGCEEMQDCFGRFGQTDRGTYKVSSHRMPSFALEFIEIVYLRPAIECPPREVQHDRRPHLW